MNSSNFPSSTRKLFEVSPSTSYKSKCISFLIISLFQISVLKNAFLAFEYEKTGTVLTEDIGTIVEMLGHRLDDKSLKQAIKEADPAGAGKLDFEPFACFASKYVEVEEDAEAVAKELREAFLLYDRDGKSNILFFKLVKTVSDLYRFQVDDFRTKVKC